MVYGIKSLSLLYTVLSLFKTLLDRWFDLLIHKWDLQNPLIGFDVYTWLQSLKKVVAKIKQTMIK
jgi:hypothetical protein